MSIQKRIDLILKNIDEELLTFSGENYFDTGLLDSLNLLDLINELEDEFDIVIDAEYVIEDNFKTKESIMKLVEKLVK